ncbi:MAG: hypothetical protein AAF501_15800 [Pseudomonadota bacterium]
MSEPTRDALACRNPRPGAVGFTFARAVNKCRARAECHRRATGGDKLDLSRTQADVIALLRTVICSLSPWAGRGSGVEARGS